MSQTLTKTTPPAPRRPVPNQVQRSIFLWVFAIGAGAAETLLFVTQAVVTDSAVSAIATQVAVRMVIYLVLLLAVLRLRKGENWLRIAVAVVIGGVGTLSMVVSPITWLAAGNSLFGFLAAADAWTLSFTALRTVHVLAVLSALVLMFLPAANDHFKALSPSTSGPAA